MEAILTNRLGQNLTSDPIPFTLKGPYLSENAQQQIYSQIYIMHLTSSFVSYGHKNTY